VLGPRAQRRALLACGRRSVVQRAGRAGGGDREAELLGLTLPELKGLCRERSLKLGGTKAELVGRLLRCEGGEDAAPAPSRRRSRPRLVREGTKAEEQAEEGEAADAAAEEEAEAEVEVVGDEAEVKVSKHSSDYDDDGDEESSVDKLLNMVTADKVSAEGLQEAFLAFTKEIPAPGEIVTGTVVSLVEWGAFIDLDDTGWTGLVHVSEISDTFISNIEEWLVPGDRVTAMVIRDEKRDRRDRLSLSIRRVAKKQMITDADARLPDGRLLGGPFPQPVVRPTSAADASASGRVLRINDMLPLEARVNAIEIVLNELGYSRALLAAARQESMEATQQQLAVPPVESLLGSMRVAPEAEKAKTSASKDSERQAIDAVMRDLSEGVAGGSGDLDELDLDAVLRSNGSTRPSVDDSDVDLHGAEDVAVPSDEELSEYLTDSFATSTFSESSSFQKSPRG